MSEGRPGASGAGRRPRVLVLPDPAAASRAAVDLLVQTGGEAVERTGRFVLALSGGSTPTPLYRLLATPALDGALPWRRTHVLWSDERCVPATDERSNYRLVADAGLLRRTFAGVHRMPGEADPEEGARRYEQTLRELFPQPGPPRIDVALLGLGEDGHTASLFPGSPVRREARRWVVPVEPHGGVARLSLTLPVLTAAEHVVFLVTGPAKAAIVRAILDGPGTGLPGAEVLWGARDAALLLDEGAAAGAGG